MARYLSVDADVHGLFVAVGNLTRGQFSIERTLVASDGAKALSPSTAVELGGKLKQLLKDAGIAPAPVLLTIGRDRVVLKEIKHPPSPPQDEAAIVRFQALKELTDAPEEVILDYSPIPFGNASSGERKALVAFLRKDAFTAAKVFCEVAGLKLASGSRARDCIGCGSCPRTGRCGNWRAHPRRNGRRVHRNAVGPNRLLAIAARPGDSQRSELARRTQTQSHGVHIAIGRR